MIECSKKNRENYPGKRFCMTSEIPTLSSTWNLKKKKSTPLGRSLHVGAITGSTPGGPPEGEITVHPRKYAKRLRNCEILLHFFYLFFKKVQLPGLMTCVQTFSVERGYFCQVSIVFLSNWWPVRGSWIWQNQVTQLLLREGTNGERGDIRLSLLYPWEMICIWKGESLSKWNLLNNVSISVQLPAVTSGNTGEAQARNMTIHRQCYVTFEM